MRRGCQWLLVLAMLAAATPAAAAPAEPDDEDDWMSRQAIQNRKHVLRHELGDRRRHHPHRRVLQGADGHGLVHRPLLQHLGLGALQRRLLEELLDRAAQGSRAELAEPGLAPGDPPEIEFFGNSNLVFKPFYGKLAYLNRSLVYGEFYLTAGPAASWYNTDRDRLALGADVGFGFRVHMSRYWSARFDVRYYRFQTLAKKTSGDDVLFLQLGIALNLGGKQ